MPRVSAFMSAVLLSALLTPPSVAIAENIEVRAAPVALRLDGGPDARAGRLLYRGGLALTSTDTRFGGLSGLRVDDDRMIAISDHGYRIEIGLRHDQDHRLSGIRDVTLKELRGPKGASLAELPGGNAEAIAADSAGGLVIAFEGRGRIWTYPPGGGAPKPMPALPGLEKAPRNEGIEALTRLADGRLLAVSEGLRERRGLAGWVGGAGGWQAVVWRNGEGFRPTGAATLPDGDVLVLERRVFPPAARLRLLASHLIRAGAVLDGVEIARLDGAMTFDNMEGIDARRGDGGETLIYLVSDDNYAFYQRTLLLMFQVID